MKEKILLLHGALGAASQFETLEKILKEKFSVLTLDFEGHGKSPSTERNFRIEYFAENLEDFLKENCSVPANIFGYSMGGYVALYLASQKPELINKIFTLGTKFAWSPETAAHETKFLNPEKMLEKVPQFAQALSDRHGAQNWRSVVEKTKEMMIALGEENILSEELLGNIRQRVRVAVGDRDTMVTFDETIAAYRALADAELEVLPDTHHPLEKISFERISNSIENFFL